MRDNHMVAYGVVKGVIGGRAYRFDPSSKIKRGRTVWRHKIDVAWSTGFKEFRYHDRSPNTSVLKLNDWEIEQFSRYVAKSRDQSVTGALGTRSRQEQQIEDLYPRISSALRIVIRPLHRELANALVRWLKDAHQISAVWERQQIDVRFWRDGCIHVIAELKIAYGGNTRHAIREAIGQILEYNHYPGRQEFDEWLLVLDQAPSAEDKRFIERLRKEYALPLSLGWKDGEGFLFHPRWTCLV
jgi:hypothetical protein